MLIKINYDNDELFCFYSKERIQIGKKYVEISEDDGFVKTYKMEYAPTIEDDEEPYICEE